MWLSVLSLLLILIGGTFSAANNTIHDTKDAYIYLNKYGYNPCSYSSKNIRCSVDHASMLRDFQQRHGLKMTGALDAATKHEMNLPRCGNPDSRSLGHSKWSRSSLTWSLRSHPRQISKARASAIINEAFNAWSTHIPLQFSETCSTCKADFVIETGRYGHNCNGGSFDGSGGTLAHAFFPQDGRIHFDADEQWIEAFDGSGINFYLVAVHEIGHALGLDHNHDRTSIMYPSYSLVPRSSMLPDYDRRSIQAMYGAPKGGGGTGGGGNRDGWTLIAAGSAIFECPYIKHGDGSSLAACQASCDATNLCNAFNFRANDDCVLRQCSSYPPAVESYAPYAAWAKKINRDGWTLIAAGSAIFECPYIKHGDGSSLAACQASCDTTNLCNAFNFRANDDCVLRQCSSYPPAVESYAPYAAWAKKTKIIPASISQLNAVKTAQSIHLSATYSKDYTWYQAYIDTDNNPATGFSVQGIGADLLIETNHYYYYKGNSGNRWLWPPYDGASSLSINGRKYTWRLAVANLKLPITSFTQVVFAGSNGLSAIEYSSRISVTVTD